MKLGNRLLAVSDMVEPCRVLADIGSDHAYLAIALLREGRIERAIVTDVAEAPLNSAKNNIIEAGYEHLCSIRLGDGLNTLKQGEADTIVIAGMGGNMIIKILCENPHIARCAESIILQPMQHKRELREYLNTNAYSIISERVVSENGKFYEIIKAKDGSQRRFTNVELEFGFAMLKDSTYNNYVRNKQNEYIRIIDERKKSGKNFDNDEIFELIKAAGWFLSK